MTSLSDIPARPSVPGATQPTAPSSPDPSWDVAAPGHVLDGKYHLVREIGVGGMGHVFEAEHTRTGRRVAVKVLRAQEPAARRDALERFRREALAAGRIESPHVVQVLDAGTDRRWSSPYLVMELLRGRSVQALLRRARCVPPEIALAIVGQACRGLVRAHAAGILHRDVKPANLYLAAQDGGETLVKVLDFGLAKAKAAADGTRAWPALTLEGQVLGSPLYMSPEQAMGLPALDERTDVWSLGTVLYELLSGAAPHAHDGGSLGVLMASICSRPARPLRACAPWIDAKVADIVHRALAIDPAARFPDAGAMLDAIADAAPAGLTLRSDSLPPAASARAGRSRTGAPAGTGAMQTTTEPTLRVERPRERSPAGASDPNAAASSQNGATGRERATSHRSTLRRALLALS